MQIKLSDKAKAAIEAALNRGNDIKIHRKGRDVVIREIREKTIYSASPIVEEPGQ